MVDANTNNREYDVREMNTMSNYANSNPENWDYMSGRISRPMREPFTKDMNTSKSAPSLWSESYTATLEAMYHYIGIGEWGTASECAAVMMALRELRK